MAPEWWQCIVFPYVVLDDDFARFLVEYHRCQNGMPRWVARILLRIVRSLDKNPSNPNRRRSEWR